MSSEAELRAAVGHLGLPGRDAVVRMGSPGRTADRMAHRFDEAYTQWVDTLSDLPGEALLASLQRIDAALLELAKPENRDLWSDDALCAHPAWEGLRRHAREAGVLLGADAAAS